jgi:paraquat-inducible protein B
MSVAASPRMIGGFVLGAIALLALAMAVFGGTQLFTRTGMVVTYFDGSVKGLREGSNVVFRGVRVGFVQNIALLTDVETLSPKIEVTMELVPDSMKVLRNGRQVEASLDSVVSIEELVDAGFSAQLGSESFVTGQLLVELDFRPNRDLTLFGGESPYPEIPSVPSDIQQAITRFQTLASKIEETVDLATLNRQVQSVLTGLDELVNSAELRDAIAGIAGLINDDATRRLPEAAAAALTELREAARLGAQLIDDVDGDVAALLAELAPAARRLNAALEQAERTLGALGRQAAGDSPQIYQLEATLQELEDAASAMRQFFDSLERDPRALLRGRRP